MPKVKDRYALRQYATETIIGFFGLRATNAQAVDKWSRGVVLRYLRDKEDRSFEESGALADSDVDQADVDDLAAWIAGDYLPLWDLGGFAQVIGNIRARGGDATYVQYLLALPWPQNKPPRILGGFTQTTGNFGADTFLIRISMDLTDPTAILDTILFECCNAVQVDAFKAAKKTFLAPGQKKPEQYGLRMAEIEYESDRMYVGHLKSLYHAATLGDLLNSLSVPQLDQTPQAYQVLPINHVILPSRAELPRQAARTALWFFKTDAWTNDQRKLAWISSNHGDEVARTSDLYRIGSVQKIVT